MCFFPLCNVDAKSSVEYKAVIVRAYVRKQERVTNFRKVFNQNLK